MIGGVQIRKMLYDSLKCQVTLPEPPRFWGNKPSTIGRDKPSKIVVAYSGKLEIYITKVINSFKRLESKLAWLEGRATIRG
jgi:hypothetical protein